MSTLQKEIDYLKEHRRPLVEKCTNDPEKPCSKTTAMNGQEGEYCTVYFDPASAWRRGDCPMADLHLRSDFVETKEKLKVRIGQQKQKKR